MTTTTQTRPRTTFAYGNKGSRLSLATMDGGDREVVCLRVDTQAERETLGALTREAWRTIDGHTRSQRRRQQIATLAQDAAVATGAPLSASDLTRLSAWAGRHAGR